MGAERALAPQGLDVDGMAADLRERAQRYAPIYQTHPALSTVVRLLHRNPSAAGAALKAIEAELATMPGGGVGLDQPLFPAKADGHA